MTALKHRRYLAQLIFEAALDQPANHPCRVIPQGPSIFESIQPDQSVLMRSAIKDQRPPEECLITPVMRAVESKPPIQPQSQPPLPPRPGCNPSMPFTGGLRVQRSIPSYPIPTPPRRSDLLIGSVCFFVGISVTIFSALVAGGFICSGVMSAYAIPLSVLGMASGMLAIYGIGRLQRYGRASSALSAHHQFIWQNRLGFSAAQQPPATLSPLTARLPGHP